MKNFNKILISGLFTTLGTVACAQQTTTTTVVSNGQNTAQKRCNDAARSAVDRGLAHAGRNAYGPAISEFNAAAAADSKCVDAYSNRGVAYKETGKIELALRDINQAIALQPNDAVQYYNLASIYAAKNQVDLGLEALDKALKLGFASADADEVNALKPKSSNIDLKALKKSKEYCKILEQNSKFLCN